MKFIWVQQTVYLWRLMTVIDCETFMDILIMLSAKFDYKLIITNWKHFL